MAIPTYVATGTVSESTSNATPLTPGAPSGTAGVDYNFLLMQVFYRASVPSIAIPDGWFILPKTTTGWLAASSTFSTTCLGRYADGSGLDAPSFLVGTNEGTLRMARTHAFNNVHATDPVELGPYTTATSTNVTAGRMNTAGPNRLAVALIAIGDDLAQSAFVAATGGTYTEAVAEYTTTTGADASFGIQTAAMVSQGQINAGNFGITSFRWQVHLMALRGSGEAAYPWVFASFIGGSSTTTTSWAPSITEGTVPNPDDLFVVASTARDNTSGASPSIADNSGDGVTWDTMHQTSDKKLTIWSRKGSQAMTDALAIGAVTVTVTQAATGSTSGVLLILRGANGLFDFNQESNASGDEGHGTRTPSYADSLCIMCISNYDNDNAVTSPTWATLGAALLSVEHVSTGGSDCATHFSVKPQAGGPSATGSFSWAQTNNATYSVFLSAARVPDAPFPYINGGYIG